MKRVIKEIGEKVVSAKTVKNDYVLKSGERYDDKKEVDTIINFSESILEKIEKDLALVKKDVEAIKGGA